MSTNLYDYNELKSIKVLDKGFVKLIECIKNPESKIVAAARVSVTGAKKFSPDKNLLLYLLKNNHLSPFDMVNLTFHIKSPIFVTRQWMRYRNSSFSEMSGRYVKIPSDFYLPETLNSPSSTNKQAKGSTLSSKASKGFLASMRTICSQTLYLYETMLESGVSREQARMILPLNIYTEFWWQCSLRCLINFILQRDDSNSQEEIRQYAMAIKNFILKEYFPITFSYLVSLNSKSTILKTL